MKKPIFDKKETKVCFYHITWVTHNSRTSSRMIEYKVKKGEPIILDENMEIELTKYILETAKEKNITIFAYNICKDHVHILLSCIESELSNIICSLKSKSTFLYKKNNSITESIKIWAQKYNCSYIETEEKFYSCINYIKNNRNKHLLPKNHLLDKHIEQYLYEYP